MGQGNCTFIAVSSGSNSDPNIEYLMMIDAGDNQSLAYNYYTDHFDGKAIDSVIITHCHADHYEGLKRFSATDFNLGNNECPVYLPNGDDVEKIKDYLSNELTKSDSFYTFKQADLRSDILDDEISDREFKNITIRPFACSGMAEPMERADNSPSNDDSVAVLISLESHDSTWRYYTRGYLTSEIEDLLITQSESHHLQ
ncbi:MBL fold metallo-hydrolase [Lentisphaerota bacterium WC36G]